MQPGSEFRLASHTCMRSFLSLFWTLNLFNEQIAFSYLGSSFLNFCQLNVKKFTFKPDTTSGRHFLRFVHIVYRNLWHKDANPKISPDTQPLDSKVWKLQTYRSLDGHHCKSAILREFALRITGKTVSKPFQWNSIFRSNTRVHANSLCECGNLHCELYPGSI